MGTPAFARLIASELRPGEPASGEGCPAEALCAKAGNTRDLSTHLRLQLLPRPVSTSAVAGQKSDSMAGSRFACPGLMPPKRFVYVLRSVVAPERHYVGLTSNVEARLAVHNSGGSDHTSKNRPWRLLAAMEFSNERSATRFEKYLKSGSGRAFCKRHFE